MWYLRLAIKLTRDNSAVSVQLAHVVMAAEDFTEAVSSFVRGLSLALRAFVTRLQSGIALGNSASCARHSWPAPRPTRVPAQRGRWQHDMTPLPALREAVKHAVKYVDQGRRQLFRVVLDPRRECYGSTELARVECGMAIYFSDLPANIPDSRQRPRLLYRGKLASRA